MIMNRLRVLFAACLALGLLSGIATTVKAHPLNNGYSQVTIENKAIQYELTLPEASLLAFDTDHNNELSSAELESQRSAIQTYLQRHLQLELPSGQLDFTLVSMDKNEKTGISAVSFQLQSMTKSRADSLTIHYSLLFDDVDPAHINFLVIANGNDVDQAVFDASNRMYHYQSLVKTSMLSSAWDYFLLGIEHILTGYDHLLFLLSLLIIATSLKDIVKIVTAFTVAHSTTLFLAATGYLHVNSRWIESGIALTIAYVAIENIFTRSVRMRWAVTFGFGLIHGMGFAGAISETGLPEQYLISSLLSFNLGVETGQLAIVMIVLPFLLSLQKKSRYRTAVIAVSALIALFAAYLFFQRIGS